MRDSMIIYRSFYEAIKELPKENQADVWNAVYSYGLDFEEVELTGISHAVFMLMKPQLDLNNQRYKNSLKGGRKTKTKPKRNREQTESKPRANQNETKETPVFTAEEKSCYKKCLNYFTKSLHPTSKRQQDLWLTTIRELNQKDKLTFEEIERIIKGARDNSFLAKNFQSITKLRKKNGSDVYYYKYYQDYFKQEETAKKSETTTNMKYNPNVKLHG